MLQTIPGIYRNGEIELSESPQGIVESQVFVTFLTPQLASTTHHLMSFSMFADVQQSTEADFKDNDRTADAIMK
jgi:hypothetical protein